jgi:hypothetical protein
MVGTEVAGFCQLQNYNLLLKFIYKAYPESKDTSRVGR